MVSRPIRWNGYSDTGLEISVSLLFSQNICYTAVHITFLEFELHSMPEDGNKGASHVAISY